MKRIIATLLALAVLLVPQAALAYDPLGDACSAGTNSSAACFTDKSNSTPTDTINHISTLVASIAGAVAVIIIVVSGFMFVTSGGDAGKTKSARNALIGSLIGLIIILAARSILYLILRKVS